jgi:hypothetical protein
MGGGVWRRVGCGMCEEKERGEGKGGKGREWQKVNEKEPKK